EVHVRGGMLGRFEVLGACGRAVGGLQPIAGRRVADAGAGVDIVVAEGRAHQLLDEESLFVGAARRGDPADRTSAVFRLDAFELGGRVVDGLFPGYLAPWIGALLSDHRLQNAIPVRGIAVSEAALDAGMAAIGLAVLV